MVNDSRYARARDDVPATIFPSALQRTGYGGNHVVVRSDVPPGQLENALREAVGRVSRDLPVPEVSSQVARIAESSARERLFAQLLTIFGVFALLLASIGLHGVVSYSVAPGARVESFRAAPGRSGRMGRRAARREPPLRRRAGRRAHDRLGVCPARPRITGRRLPARPPSQPGRPPRRPEDGVGAPGPVVGVGPSGSGPAPRRARPHSERSASMGSTIVARRAGTYAATRATRHRMPPTPAYVSGSVTSTS